MASINLIKASDGTGNASTATVQTVRNSGVTTIIVDTVNNIPATFMGSMGTPHTFVDPVTSEEITVISEATAVDFTGHVSGANLEIDSIAPGYTDLGSAISDIVVIRPTTDWANNVADVLLVSHDNDGTLKAGAVDNAAVLASDVVETAKIKDANVTNAKLATGIDSAKLSNPYKFSAYRSAAQNSVNGFTKVLCETEVFDTGSNYDAVTNHRFTAPVAGFYFFTGMVAMGVTSTSVWQALLYRNGISMKTGTLINSAVNYQQSIVSGLIELTVGQYVELYLYSNAAVALSPGAPSTYFEGFLVSAT